ncbi:hypothetical protein ACQP1U_18135 [Actinomycetota bacterium]
MYAVLSVHVPKPEYRGDLSESMRRFATALRGQPGVVGIHTLEEIEGERLVGLALFVSVEAAEALMPLARAAVADDDFDLWEAQDVEGLRLLEI